MKNATCPPARYRPLPLPHFFHVKLYNPMRVICTFTIDRPVFFPFFFSPFLSPTADLNGIDDRDEWYDLEKAGVVPRCDNSRLLRRGISQPRKTRTPALGTATMHPPTSEVGPTWRWRVTSGVWVLGHKGNIVYVANAGAVLAAGAGPVAITWGVWSILTSVQTVAWRVYGGRIL